jgi:lipopolysaccharide/colanic/teichoic acid biosynthesis glycosyltransferase
MSTSFAKRPRPVAPSIRRHPVTRKGWRDDAAYLRTKRVLDVAICLAILPVVGTLILLCALAIRLESAGPIFFVQQRTGKGGRRFGMWKLRTMVPDAEAIKSDLADLNELPYPDFKIRNDPRVTRVGRVLRATSLDELPQIINVLAGDMSLVGPRPTSFSTETYRLWHTARLEVQPGITGLWQISGRGEVDFDERLRLDIAYIRSRSIRTDLSILLRTVAVVTNGRGAH